jgi:O-antigen biosynthesis protein WbqP
MTAQRSNSAPVSAASGRLAATEVDVRWIDARTGRHVGIALLLGPRPEVVLADVDSASAAAPLAAWLGAPLLVDARAGHVPAPAPSALRRARRVLAADAAQRAALEAAGIESGRVLVIDSACPPPDAARGPVTEVATVPEALRELRRLARGRAIRHQPQGAYGAIKRAIDLLAGLTLLVLLGPLLLVVALLIRLDSPGPALFRQRRIGRATSEFTILKFRTMLAGTPDLASHLVGPGSNRVTKLGRFLRRASIDELPQLWHLITGEMSLVGPRPALHNQYDLIALRQERGVDALKPGVTGWAQVNGRDDIPLERKVEFDHHYLEHVSAAHDVAIIARTVIVLFSDRGTY